MDMYLDGDDGESTPQTSHPTFVAVAPDSFYDEADDLQPFGNDEGWDTLRLLEDYYRGGGSDEQAHEVISEMLAHWDFRVDEGWSLDERELAAWVDKNSSRAMFLMDEANACIAAALGQFKIRGLITQPMAQRGEVAVGIRRRLGARQADQEPDWPVEEDRAVLDEIARVIAAAPR
ncbi:hypothetical protein EK0264_12505 [Epidermidibacterium keratini]|uniref:Uncharacterized protein n=1 Tax=Epidermidibacterium keratini TaxID=1891644 RepID=A0A7L4YPP4_9ACTN|nr:hypothetical protein [Epidermidibacterium keratini]QHC01028.1 hypothetical protein EK0264_12505 [Epidermidibacterium keratini]